jgi:hypothetical protein
MYDSKGQLKQVYRCKDSFVDSELKIVSLFIEHRKLVSLNESFGNLYSLEIDTCIIVFTGFDGYGIDTLIEKLTKQLARG